MTLHIHEIDTNNNLFPLRRKILAHTKAHLANTTNLEQVLCIYQLHKEKLLHCVDETLTGI